MNGFTNKEIEQEQKTNKKELELLGRDFNTDGLSTIEILGDYKDIIKDKGRKYENQDI